MFTKRNGSHPACDIAQATQRSEWNNPNCRVAPPRDAPLPSFFRRGSWVSHSFCQPDTGQQVANNSAGDGWHLHLRRCRNPTQLWLPARRRRCSVRRRSSEGVQKASLPRGRRTYPDPGRGACRLYLRRRARAPHLGSHLVPPSPRGGAAPRPGSRLRPEGSGGCAARSPALSSSSNPLQCPAPATRGRGPTARWERRASWRPSMFFHKGRAAEEEADKKMPLSPPPQGHHAESSPSRTPKKHTPFRIWRSKKKQQPLPSDCGVFVPHPPPAPLCEAR